MFSDPSNIIIANKHIYVKFLQNLEQNRLAQRYGGQATSGLLHKENRYIQGKLILRII